MSGLARAAPDAVVVLGVVVGIAVLWGGGIWSDRRAQSLLNGWARAGGFEILGQEHCWFFRGPFFWLTGKGQRVYRVQVRDQDGRIRNGYVRVGGWWLGLWSDNVEERWD